jgi:antitoxin ParD1/3/4
VPTRNVSLTAAQDAFIERVVRVGEYQNASEAIRDALRVLQQKRREDALKLRGLRTQIKAGLARSNAAFSPRSLKRISMTVPKDLPAKP